MAAQTNVISLAKPPALPESWIEKLFSRLSAMYGRKFADLWAGCNLAEVKAVWAEDLAGCSGEEIKRGLDACKTRTFPPTLPEFLMLCRKTVEYELLFMDAVKAMRTGEWDSKLLYWTTQKAGAFEVRSESYKRMEKVWKSAVDQCSTENLPDIPPPREALPAPGQQSVSREEASKRVDELGSVIGRVDHKAWAKRILANPKAFQQISVKFAQEAMA